MAESDAKKIEGLYAELGKKHNFRVENQFSNAYLPDRNFLKEFTSRVFITRIVLRTAIILGIAALLDYSFYLLLRDFATTAYLFLVCLCFSLIATDRVMKSSQFFQPAMNLYYDKMQAAERLYKIKGIFDEYSDRIQKAWIDEEGSLKLSFRGGGSISIVPVGIQSGYFTESWIYRYSIDLGRINLRNQEVSLEETKYSKRLNSRLLSILSALNELSYMKEALEKDYEAMLRVEDGTLYFVIELSEARHSIDDHIRAVGLLLRSLGNVDIEKG